MVCSKYLETKSFAKTQQNFLHVFGTELAPTKSAIFKMVKKFQYAGTVKNLNKKCEDRETHSGRKRLRTSHVIAMVRESVEQSPKRSTRKRSQTLPISRSTMMRVMTEDLGMFPYRIQTHQKLSEADKNRRKEMAKVLLDKIEESDTFLKNLWLLTRPTFT